MKNLSPKQKKVAIALLAGAGLAVVVLLMRRGSSAAAAPAAAASPDASGDLAAATGLPAGPTTFADNGAQAQALGDAVTSGLADVGSSLDNLTSGLGPIMDQLNGLPQSIAALIPPAPAEAASPGTAPSVNAPVTGPVGAGAAPPGTPSVKAQAPTVVSSGPQPNPVGFSKTAGPQLHVNPANQETYETIVKGGKVYHYYAGRTGPTKYVYIRPASGH